MWRKYLQIFLRFIKEKNKYQICHITIKIKQKCLDSSPYNYYYILTRMYSDNEWNTFLIEHTDFIDYNIKLFKDFLNTNGVYDAFFTMFNKNESKEWRAKYKGMLSKHSFDEYCRACKYNYEFVTKAFLWVSCTEKDKFGHPIDWEMIDRKWARLVGF